MRPNPIIALAAQAFSGSQLVRGIGTTRFTHLATLPEARFLLVAARRVCVQSSDLALKWFDLPALEQLGLALPQGGDTLRSADGLPAALYYLGSLADASILAVDVSDLDRSASWEAALVQQDLSLRDLRSLLMVLPPEDLAVAGHAVALSQWHQAHRFCPRCGAPTTSVSGGSRRECADPGAHRLYPRTDPVVIMLVENADGSKALLGRSQKVPPGMLTCLAGFIDQGESIEEAVVREVREEAGVGVHSVQVAGSQPWPLGRGGSCELMVGCLARADSETLHVDLQEMAECRWVSREEVAQALSTASSPGSPYVKGRAVPGDAAPPPPGFYVPPPAAIAHHLMKAWVERGPGHDGAPQMQQLCSM